MRDSAILSLSIKPPHFVQSRHHHIARVGRGRRDQREVASDAADPLVDPLRVGAANRVEPRKQTARWLKGWRELRDVAVVGANANARAAFLALAVAVDRCAATGRTLLADQAALVFAPWSVDFFLRVRPWKT